MIFRFFKFGIFFLIALAFYVIAWKAYHILGEDVVKYLIFPIVFLMLNYAFFKLVLYIISYYGNLIVLYNRELILLRTTLIKVNFVEVISLDKITKFDMFMDGIVPNLIGYGTLVIEQNRETVRELKFVPDPNRVVRILTKMKSKSSKKNIDNR